SVDVVLGDRFGASADAEITAVAEDCLSAAGLRVVRNRPYAGGFSTENHGRPQLGRHALQIEINRNLYLDEGRQQKTADFAGLKQLLDTLCQRLADVMSQDADAADLPMAAE
ncbi:MAG: N-formylglutamate amidohydrolase, partial [Phyllobacteriaceae bacterium]|nr:N-formylglutamate amidohydrolase [Phyllobacteriaceae bacterium]